ncbi:amidase signature enzyme [Viridothelium virens]|uniref:Amidase signature enzyme n=1 Tax=Viridothelium virens TaxID=1048519 RepID=A0A6A6GYW4_VIRVR|nr:amidase signature enzyme [Viridothelium virens]
MVELRMQMEPQPFRLGKQDFLALWPQDHLLPTETAIENESGQPLKKSNPPKTRPTTVVFVGAKRRVTAGWLHSAIEQYRYEDDVFQLEFLEAVLFTYTGSDPLDVTIEARNYLQRFYETTMIGTRHVVSKNAHPERGPYLYTNGDLRPAWKLYEDTNGAFLNAIIPGPTREPFELRAAGILSRRLRIAVPSRIASFPSDLEHHEKPLASWRIAVKDIFHISGIRTSACNKAYHELYPPTRTTAACLEALYVAGAVIVGKTKLASFAATEEPVECIDWQAPRNPRADGYQSPAGSSSSSAVAVATYPWLDISIGSDTSGNGRRPGHWNGCFAMRPTHGLLSHHGFIPSFPRFDVPTFFGRDLRKCKRFAETWYAKDQQATLDVNRVASLQKRPAIINLVDYMSEIANADQMTMVDRFVADLELSLGVQQDKISIERLWNSHQPPEAQRSSFQEYMHLACRNSFFYDDFHNFEQFRNDYRLKFSKEPYVSPRVRWQWDLSSNITPEERNLAIQKVDVFREWFLSTVMREKEREAFVVIPIEEISPRYRDEALSEHFNPAGVPNLFLSPILGTPELTVPVGEYSYKSLVSGQTERLPVAVSIIVPPGQDLQLFDTTIDCLEAAGRPTHVLTGKTLFPDG